MASPDCLDNWNPSTAQRKVRDGVAEIFGVAPHLLIGRGRRHPLVDYRHVAMWVVKQCFPTLSYPMVGRLFGGRDHSTIIHGVRNVEARREADAEFRALTDAMRDGFGVQKRGIMIDDRLHSRVNEVCSRVTAEHLAVPVDEDVLPRPQEPRRVRAKNDFSEDDCDARKRSAASDALGAALAREGMVCR